MGTKKEDCSNHTQITEEDIVKYLMKHSDFLVKHPNLLEVLELPTRYSGEAVVDFQHEALRRLRAKQDVLVDNSRSNMSVQQATHEAILAMMEACSLDEFIGIIQDELPILLDIDMAALAIEGSVDHIDISSEGMPILLPQGEVDRRLDENDVLLVQIEEAGDHLFGASRSLIKSAAIARLYSSDIMPAGLLILGSRDEDCFHPKQGTELITFMARVSEILVEGWLSQQDMDMDI